MLSLQKTHLGPLALCLSFASLVGPQRLFANDVKGEILEDVWQVILIRGQRLGYAHTLTWETGKGDDRRIWSESVTQMTVARFGGGLAMTLTQLTEEDAAGNLKSFRLNTNNPPISHTVVSGEVRGDTLHLETTAAGKTTASTQPWDADVKSPVYQERLLEEYPIEVGESRTLRVFDPQFLKIAEVTLTGQAPATTELLDGSQPQLDRTRIAHSMLPGFVITSYQNDAGETLKTETNLLGMVTYTVSQDEAVKEIAGAQLDLALDTLVSVEPIADAHRKKKIVYDVSVEGPQKMLPLPEGLTQTVARTSDQTVRVTVSAADPSAAGPTAPPAKPPAMYTQPSRYLETGHPQVRAHAEAAAANLTTPTEIALAMERYVHEKLAEKNFSTALATAAEVASSLEGDCTEHAMLLAAMLRVKEIPSRVAVGLVSSPRHSGFAGHMWTEAYLNGHWVPFDATLGLGGTGAGHLKFSDSGLSDDGPAPVTVFVPLVGLLGKMRIEVVEANSE